MRKPAFYIREIKRRISTAFVFATQIVQSLNFLNPKFQVIFCGCTAWLVSDLVGKPSDRFSELMTWLIQALRQIELSSGMFTTIITIPVI